MDEEMKYKIIELLDGVRFRAEWIMTSLKKQMRNNEFSCEMYITGEIQRHANKARELLENY